MTADLLESETTMPCPECGEACHQGVRGPGMLIATCPPHGVFLTALRGARPDAGCGWMDCEERLWLLETALSRFMIDPDKDDFMAVQSSTLACNQIVLRFGGGRFWVEVDCREWGCLYCGDRPLDAAALERLARLGFARVGGGPNPAAMDVPRDPRRLAMLADDAMIAAYGESADHEVGVHFKRATVMRDVLARLSRAPESRSPGLGQARQG